ncbi:MAG: hypothetical protein LBL94_04660, partial [Prevotellaceae bacterium]|nr:hypothetical protein [Prevotellaceae bacterium]
YLTARKTNHTAIYFYQHFVPNGTKIERKYFYVNITFLTPHPTGFLKRQFEIHPFLSHALGKPEFFMYFCPLKNFTNKKRTWKTNRQSHHLILATLG